MSIARSLPPAATPITLRQMVSGISGIFRGKQELDRFESELKARFGVRHCFAVSSGKAAFTLILLALRELFPDRDEVLIPAFNCYSVPSAVIRAGLRVRLCDLHPNTFDFDFAQLSAMLPERRPHQHGELYHAGSMIEHPSETSSAASVVDKSAKRLLAIVPTHLFGFPADVAGLRKLLHDPAVTIVEDAAQAMGETSHGAKLGTLGDVGFFSLARGKALSVVEGGVILTNRDDIAMVLSRLIGRLPGYGVVPLLKLIIKAMALMMFMHPRLFWIPRSMPILKLGETLFDTDFLILRMSPFQAGLARNWRDNLERLGSIRKKNANRWFSIFQSWKIGGSMFIGGQSAGLLRFPLRVGDRNEIQTLLRESRRMGLGIMPTYPTSIDAIPELSGKVPAGRFPVAESCAREVVTLPTHGYVTQQDVKVISRLLSQCGALM
jgi:perosamine synthetase